MGVFNLFFLRVLLAFSLLWLFYRLVCVSSFLFFSFFVYIFIYIYICIYIYLIISGG